MTWLICALISDVTILKQFYFLLEIYFSLTHPGFFPVTVCFLCALYNNVTALSFYALEYTLKKPFWTRKVCPEFINVMIENNLSHKSGARSTLYKVAMNFSPLLLHVCIRTWPFCFAVTWCPSATSMYLSAYSNDHGMKSETSGVIWHVAPKYKIQLVNWKLSPYFTLLCSSSLDIRAIDAYILWSSLVLPLSHAWLQFH